MSASPALHRRKADLRACLREVPAGPGVYRFYDASGAVIYVGKSVCLRDRVRSYFTGRRPSRKLRRLRQEIARVDWERTGSELEALILESRLVKEHQPRFNVLLREFVPLPYVRVDLRDPFPRLEIRRSPCRDGALYFGPFHRGGVLEGAVGALADALRLRTCPVPGERVRQQRPCYRHHLGLCSAPCLGAVDPGDYRRAIDEACAALQGRQESVLARLERRMERAAERLQFELAARLRDAVRLIRALGSRQHAIASAVRELSLVALCPSREPGRLCVFAFRSGRLVRQETIEAAHLRQPAQRRAMAIRLAQAVRDPAEEADPSLDPSLLDEIQIVTGWMRRNTGEGAAWSFPREGSLQEWIAALDAWLAEQATAPHLLRDAA